MRAQKAYDRGLVNRTSARDLAVLLEAIESGRAGSAVSCRALREILLAPRFRVPAVSINDGHFAVARATDLNLSTFDHAAGRKTVTRAPKAS